MRDKFNKKKDKIDSLEHPSLDCMGMLRTMFCA